LLVSYVLLAAVAGGAVMELGSIDKPGQERLFLLSTTHGAEMSGLAAFIATMQFLDKHKPATCGNTVTPSPSCSTAKHKKHRSFATLQSFWPCRQPLFLAQRTAAPR
jgi:hypothetical protein